MSRSAGGCGQQQGMLQDSALRICTGVLAIPALHLGQKNALWTICRQVQQACSTAVASLCCMQPATTTSLSAWRPVATSLKPSCAWSHFSGHSGLIRCISKYTGVLSSSPSSYHRESCDASTLSVGVISESHEQSQAAANSVAACVHHTMRQTMHIEAA